MSMCSCAECGDVFDSDFVMFENAKGDCICENCAEEMEDLNNG